MNLFLIIITTFGLALFEIVSSIDNAVINARVLSGMGEKMKKIFLSWGIIVAVFIMRGLLPWLIIWAANPTLGPVSAFTPTLSSDPRIKSSLEQSSPILFMSGGTFLLLLFLGWFLKEEKNYSHKAEILAARAGVWFYFLAVGVVGILFYLGLKKELGMGIGCLIGASAYFISEGLKTQAQEGEVGLLKSRKSDLKKLLYLEIIDASFSIDGVMGSFAYTLSIPVILIGNGIGAYVVRQLTATHLDRIIQYKYLENGAMYATFCLSMVMILNSLGIKIAEWVSPVVTFLSVGYFFYRSRRG